MPYGLVPYTVCIKIGWKWKRKRAQRPIRSFHWLIAVQQYMPFSRQWNVYAASTLFTLVHARQIFARRWQCWLFDSVWILRKIYVCMLYCNAYKTHFSWYIWLKPKWLSRFEPCTSSALNINHSCWCVRPLTQSNDFFHIVFLYHFELVTHTMRVSHYIRYVTCIVRFHRIHVNFFNCHEFITEHMQSCCDVIMTRKSIKLLRTWQEQIVEYIWQIFEIEVCPCYDAGRNK